MARTPRVPWEKLRQALAGPSQDTRAWIAIARVDDDPDAIRLDEEMGWIADVTFQSGPLNQVGPVACRVGQSAEGALVPVNRNDEVLVSITDGDANSGPVISARLQNAENPIPATVNGFPINEALAAINYILASQVNGAQVEFGAALQVQALLVQLMASTFVFLGGTPTVPPTEPVIKGLQYNAALSAFLNAQIAWAAELTAVVIATAAVAVPPVPTVTLATQAGNYAAALTAFGASSAAALSTKVLTE